MGTSKSVSSRRSKLKDSRITKRGQQYTNLLFSSGKAIQQRVYLGIPMTGVIRSEWAMARYGQVIPTNWSQSEYHQWIKQNTPLGYAVAEARNIIVDCFLRSNAEWLFFIDHDVIMPPDCFVKLNRYIKDAKYPVVCGLYFAKADPPEPLIYRGRGNSFYPDFKIGQKVWADGIPMGCTLIHRSLLEVMSADAPEYVVHGSVKIKQVFDTPFGAFFDPESHSIRTYAGTEDLSWCDRVINGGYLKKSGWGNIARKEFPFLVDTSIFCRHITMDGQVYPLTGQENKYMRIQQ